MGKSVVKIQCSNHRCKKLNPQNYQFCEQCHTPITKRYLWALEERIKADRIGELIGDRYLVKQANIVLDTKPGLSPALPEEVAEHITPYLKLFAYRLHVPQIYGYILEENEENEPIWLLEYESIPLNETSKELKYEELLPLLTEIWPQESALRQLNYLWQIASLWQPLQKRKVVSSLVNPYLLRANGSIVKLLYLQADDEESPSLQQLGQLWSRWSQNSSSNLRQFLEQLCQQLEEGNISQPGELITVLDAAISRYAHSHFKRSYQICTASSTGPSRDHNEDACYPSVGETKETSNSVDTLTIVCDGLGGQEGGEIASHMAITFLQQKVKKLSFLQNKTKWHPLLNIKKLDKIISKTNEIISDRNDEENREEKQRMGTTLVMTLAHEHEMYFANVGDSRIYLITPTGCHQITTDQDLASREVRLGYALYRDISRYPTSGALVQALGMSSAAKFYPSINRLILDSDCVFLLCSDGLSDFDRVDQYWESHILPILKHEITVEEAAQELVQMANQKNGHDNVTVGLVYCQVNPLPSAEKKVILWSEIESSLPTLLTEPINKDTQGEEVTPTPNFLEQFKGKLENLLMVILVLGLMGCIYLWFSEDINRWWKKFTDHNTIQTTPEEDIDFNKSID